MATIESPDRILQVVASLEGGAAEHVIFLSYALRTEGLEVEITAPTDNASKHNKIERYGIPFHPLPLPSSYPLAALFRLRTLIRSGGFTHIHVHGHRAACIVRLAMLLLKNAPPLVYTVHGYHPAHYPRAIARFIANGIEKLLSPFTNAFICVSNSTRAELLQAVSWIEQRCFIVENGVSIGIPSQFIIDDFRNCFRSEWEIPDDAFIIGTVARLHWQKSIHRLLEAFASLSEEFDQDILVIVGDGPEEERLENLAEELGIDDRCLFFEYMSDVHSMYMAMDLFVLPSLWEGLPLTVLEAWCAGTPVVVTDVSGSRDLVEDGLDGFVAENSVQGIADAIRRARRSANLFPEMIDHAHRKYLKQYTPRTMLERTRAVYDFCLR
jgi:glycosyltransferase involved in cell wall biosynthesis